MGQERLYNDYNIGDTFTYPSGKWLWICEIPEPAARAWINNIIPTANISGVSKQEAIDLRTQWLNKLAIVVEIDHGIIALYKHDFKCWVIKLRDYLFLPYSSTF